MPEGYTYVNERTCMTCMHTYAHVYATCMYLSYFVANTTLEIIQYAFPGTNCLQPGRFCPRRRGKSHERIRTVSGSHAAAPDCRVHFGAVPGAQKTLLSRHEIAGKVAQTHEARARGTTSCGQALIKMWRTRVGHDLT